MQRVESRLPGVYFSEPRRRTEAELPPMHVAGLVGFASRGPLHTPVQVQDLARYHDVFGPDAPRLCWDGDRGQDHHALLGACVEDFFGQGGRTAWVVRVADETRTARAEVTLAGLSRVTPAGPARATLLACSPGSWARRLHARATLERTPLQLDRLPLASAEAQPGRAFRAPSGALQRGDLVELRFTTGTGERSTWLQFVTRLQGETSGQKFWLGSAPDDGFFIEPFEASPGGSGDDAGGVRSRLSPAAGAPLAWMLGEAQSDVRVRASVLRVGLWTRLGDAEPRVLEGLGLHPRHPRYLGLLPTDAALFGPLMERTPFEAGTEALLAAANHPRFPLAADPEPDAPLASLPLDARAHAPSYLPLTVDAEGEVRLLDSPDHAPAPAELPGAEVGLAADDVVVDGLQTFDASLFVDARLTHRGASALVTEAERIAEGAPRLRGIHGLLRADTVSVIATPDAVHRSWSPAAPPVAPADLGAPEPIDVDPPQRDDGPRLVHWTSVPTATDYRVEVAAQPGFDDLLDARTVSGNGVPRAELPDLTRRCEDRFFVRVRAAAHGQPGPWSATATAWTAPASLRDCQRPMLPTLRLQLTTGSPDVEGWALDFGQLGSPPLPFDTELQEGEDLLFTTARGVDALPALRAGRRYYRVRAVAEGTVGPWSNTVSVPGNQLGDLVLDPVTGFDPSQLLLVQRTLLRLCAGRRDVVAVLSLPRHYRQDATHAHAAALQGIGLDTLPVGIGAPPGPDALGFGALFHPWLGAERNSGVQFAPADGALVGLLSEVAASEGAWRAIANRPLARVLALDPQLPSNEGLRLQQARINLITDTARGFAALDEFLLSDGGPGVELERLHVRRLMILLRRLALREGQRYVFDNNGPGLQQRVRRRFARVLSGLYLRGALRGRTEEEAFFVRAADASGRATTDQGQLLIELGIAPADPLRFLAVRLLSSGAGSLDLEEVRHV